MNAMRWWDGIQLASTAISLIQHAGELVPLIPDVTEDPPALPVVISLLAVQAVVSVNPFPTKGGLASIRASAIRNPDQRMTGSSVRRSSAKRILKPGHDTLVRAKSCTNQGPSDLRMLLIKDD